MGKVFDLSKVMKNVTKKMPSVSLGKLEPKVWLSSGCYALNWLLTKDFKKAFPLEGFMNMLAGASSSGKSYICSGNVVKDALSKGINVLLIDTEFRLDDEWLRNIGIDVDSPLLTLCRTKVLQEIMTSVKNVTDEYQATYEGVDFDDQPGMLIVIDSLGAIFSADELDRMGDGNLSMTDGMRRAQDITKMTNSLSYNIAGKKIGLMMTNHVYASGDMYTDDKIPGGQKLVFLNTQILQMNKGKLKAADVEGDKIEDAKDSEVVGIRSICRVYKSNWNKSSERIEVQIPYDKGMNPYSGLFDLLKARKILKDGEKANTYTYNSLLDGSVVFANKRRKEITNEDYDRIMDDYAIAKESGKLLDLVITKEISESPVKTEEK